MTVNHNINNFNGGISQQSAENRFDNQVTSMNNCSIDVGKGLRRRNPIKYVSDLSIDTDAKLHGYDKGDGENKFGIVFDSNGLRIFKADGSVIAVEEIGVTGEKPSEVWALVSTTYKDDIKFITVGDTTWVLNTNQVVAANTDVPVGVRNMGSFVWIKKSFDDGSGHGWSYTITLDNTKFNAVITQHDVDNYDGYAIADLGLTFSDTEHAARGLSNIIGSYEKPGYNYYEYRYGVWAEGSIIRIMRYLNIYQGMLSSIYDFAHYKNKDTGEIQTIDVGPTNAEEEVLTVVLQGHLIYSRVGGSYGYYNLMAEDGDNYVVFTETSDPSSTRTYGDDPFNRYGHGVHDVECSASDGFGDQASVTWSRDIPKLSDLPSSMGNFTREDVGIIAITGTDRDNYNEYYVEWNDSYWTESQKGLSKIVLDPKTLPAKLIQKTNGTFQFGFLGNTFEYGDDEWTDRLKGDDDSNPIPSFVNYTINSMFFYKNRLGFTSNENVILSEAGEYYNFFATTVMEVLDSDPIDVTIDGNNVGAIKNVNAISGGLTLWTDNAQYILSGGEILSPATTRVGQTSSYDCNHKIPPINVGSEIIFFSSSSLYSQAYSYSSASLNTDITTAQCITSHVSTYLSDNIYTVVVSEKHNMMFVLSRQGAIGGSGLKIYNYHIVNGEKVVSAWHGWTQPMGVWILDIYVLDNELFIIMTDGCLYTINLSSTSNSTINFVDDKGNADTSSYSSSVTMSEFNVKSASGSAIISEPFYMKDIFIRFNGDLILSKTPFDRWSEDPIELSKTRKLFIGGVSDKMYLKLMAKENGYFEINTVNIEGTINKLSRSV